MAKIFISPSSQPANTYVGGSNEQTEMRKVAAAVAPILTSKGHEVKIGSANSANNSKNESNAWGAQYHVAIHSNAGGGSGTEVFYYPGDSKGSSLAKSILDQLVKLTGKSRGIKDGKGLLEVNSTKATAVLIEVEFHDNASGAAFLRNNTQAIAQAIANGIIASLGGTVTSTPAPTPSPAGKSIETLAQEVLDGKHGNGEARKNSLGSQYAAVQALVNAKLGVKTSTPAPAGKSVDTLAREVIAGNWGNGADRKARLTAAGYNYATIQARVNAILR